MPTINAPDSATAPIQRPHAPRDGADVGGMPSTLDAASDRESLTAPVDGASTGPAPVDADFARHERIAERAAGIRQEDALEDAAAPQGDAGSLKDQGVLESLGKAVSSPVREAARDSGPAGRK